MQRRSFKYVVSVVAMGLLLCWSASSAYAAAASDGRPEVFRWTNYDIGSSGYVQGTAVSEGILKRFGIKVRTIPLGNGTSRIQTVQTKTSDFYFSAADSTYAWKGTDIFATEKWGPQKIRTVWMVKRLSTFAAATRADSGVKTLDDLRGKRVAYIVGSPSLNAAMEGALLLAGLTWKDVQVVEYPSLTAGYNSVRDGLTVAVAINSTSPVAYEMESSPGGIHWFTYPQYKDKTKEWTEFARIYPGTFPDMVEQGAGFTKGKPVYTANFPFPSMFTYDFVDENVVYWQVKSMVESFDLYEDATSDMPQWAMDICLSLGTTALWTPWHPGAIKYFKEKGVWTAELEAKNAALLADEVKRDELWKVTVAEAKAKNIAGAQFTTLWMDKLQAAGLH